MTAAVRTAPARPARLRLVADAPRRIADGVWLVRGGVPRHMHVFLLEDPLGGATAFDAGAALMLPAVAAAGAALGGIDRVVLGHAHPDHRGVAPGLGAPVFCHPAERADAEGTGGLRYFAYSRLRPPARAAFPLLLRWWDGGPVRIAGTVAEGDEVCGFRVVELPGHAPGLIGLFRERDGLALASDCFYTLNPNTGFSGHVRAPHPAFTWDEDLARASMRKLAALEPAVVWPGHARPVTERVRETLERAADC
jgi:glyoxylase-like metal-dependent hydrolase (beta-lactamase superfamily II)